MNSAFHSISIMKMLCAAVFFVLRYEMDIQECIILNIKQVQSVLSIFESEKDKWDAQAFINSLSYFSGSLIFLVALQVHYFY